MGSVRFFQPLTYTKEASAAMAVASNEFIASTPCDGLRHWWQSTVRLTRFRRKGSGKAHAVASRSRWRIVPRGWQRRADDVYAYLSAGAPRTCLNGAQLLRALTAVEAQPPASRARKRLLPI